jgi:hypothetical protein
LADGKDKKWACWHQPPALMNKGRAIILAEIAIPPGLVVKYTNFS